MYKLLIQSKAHKDAERIDDYIRYTLLNPQAANAFIDCLERRYIKIAENPYAFSREYIDNYLYRKAMVKKYMIIYRIDENTHTVHIIAIGHSLQKRKNIIKRKK